jgi:hypothetical protein
MATLAIPACMAQNRSDWQALSALPPGAKVRLSLKSRPKVTDGFQAVTEEQVTVGSVVARREDVLKLERFRTGVWSRGKTAAVGAAIGGGAGTVIGVAAGGCRTGDFICVTRGQAGAILGITGAIIGAVIGVAVPHHRTDVVYAAR